MKRWKIGLLILFVLFMMTPFSVLANSTVIDITSLVTGEATSHDCNKYPKDIYNDTLHWKQCSVCEKLLGNKSPHNIQRTDYAFGYENCYSANTYTVYCADNCGYSYVTCDPHKEESELLTWSKGYCHYKYCPGCFGWIFNEGCRDAEGNTINCNHLGTCAVCGYKYIDTEKTHKIGPDGNCYDCGEKMISVSRSFSYSSDYKYAYYTVNIVAVNPAVVFFTDPGYYTLWTNGAPGIEKTVTGNNKQLQISYTITRNEHKKSAYSVQAVFDVQCNGIACRFNDELLRIKQENTPPQITEIRQNDLSLSSDGKWVTQKELTINGAENFSNIVAITVTDDKGNIVYNGTTTVENNKWTSSFFPKLESDESGKEFTISVQDEHGYVSQKKVILYNTDMLPPTCISSSKTSTDWQKQKDYTAMATDYGSGNVKIAFNDTNAYEAGVKNGNTYSKDFTFTGDVYGSTVAAFYFIDAVGNETTQFVTIYNLDNTAPTIVSEQKSVATNHRSVSVTVSANDINNKLGASGSGVSNYSITKSSEKPGTWQDSPIFSITENGTYYLWAKDAAGNISSPYPVTVSEIYTKAQVDIIWNDNANKHLTRPSNVLVRLFRNGSLYKTQNMTGAMNAFSWTYIFDNLPAIDANGKAYSYTIDYGSITSLRNPSDAYKASGSYEVSTNAEIAVIYDITADLGNANTTPDPTPPEDSDISPYGPDPEAEEVGYTIRGSIKWEDNDDCLGYRPGSVALTLLKDGEVFTKAVLKVSGGNVDEFKFTNLPKYNDSLEAFEYTVVEEFESWYVTGGKKTDAYITDGNSKVAVYTPGSNYSTVNFQNTFVAPTEGGNPVPVIPGSTQYKTEIFLYHSLQKNVPVILKMHDTFYSQDGKESYGEYNSIEYHASVGPSGAFLSNIPAGKYDLSCEDKKLVIKDLNVSGNHVRIEGNSLYISKTNENINASVGLEFKEDTFNGFFVEERKMNYFAVHIE